MCSYYVSACINAMRLCVYVYIHACMCHVPNNHK